MNNIKLKIIPTKDSFNLSNLYAMKPIIAPTGLTNNGRKIGKPCILFK